MQHLQENAYKRRSIGREHTENTKRSNINFSNIQMKAIVAQHLR